LFALLALADLPGALLVLSFKLAALLPKVLSSVVLLPTLQLLFRLALMDKSSLLAPYAQLVCTGRQRLFLLSLALASLAKAL
jgi:hypothetical protein